MKDLGAYYWIWYYLTNPFFVIGLLVFSVVIELLQTWIIIWLYHKINSLQKEKRNDGKEEA